MVKFLAVLLLLAGAFGAGYYLGQRPVGTLQRTVAELQQSLKDVSRNVLDTTLGIERDLRKRQGLVDAKSRLVQAKAHLVDRNFGDAAKELAEAVTAVEAAAKGVKSDTATNPLRDMAGSLREVKLEITTGKQVSMKKLDELQQRMDQLLNN
ncbi:hypothetical protein [Candidatus Nitrospira nitrificans]|jgi:hypothetical protein|uniref:Uncharacterized protein n=1 Tax=Candidatus Nitrospira nitrificans TaxID=1742973 RepID=A0A0S4LII6_9BACT|nr:hypothetical protein [Candidatus Nitrospira nitrificans]CUS36392.1 conserved exported hypothetical protein [Candidatus Nitrospira nitrificans]